MENYIGLRLDGRYRVDKMIGEGGMANVYRGVDLAEGEGERTVAIKILKDEYRDNEELVRRFKNEGRAISVLNHPNIVKVFDVGVSPKLQYIVMEYISGITLKEYIEQRGEPLTYKEVVHFTTQVLQAIQHAHDKGIVHRDIKPQNIMILESGSVKVMDFGIARLARSEIHTANEQAIGSVHYISPEQAQGADTDPRADIYSVGIMMYEMLTGRLPFEDESAVQVAIKQISHAAAPVKVVNPSVPEGLSEITMKAMVKQPRLRYQSAIDMLRDIEEFKVNPSIKFEYDYLLEDDAVTTVGKVMSENRRPNGQPARPSARPPAGGAKSKGRKGKKPKRKKRIGLLIPIVLGITVAVAGVSVVYAFDLINNSTVSLFGEYEEISLPDFTRANIDDVKDVLKREPYNNLRLKQEDVYDEAYPAGMVIRQVPESNNDSPKVVKGNQLVTLYVSKGVEELRMEDLSGMTRKEAINAVLEMGVTPYARPMPSQTVPSGKVISTEPLAGDTIEVKKGTIVTIYYSSDIKDYERTVPGLIGLPTLEDAQAMLKIYDMTVGEVKEEFSPEPAGTILRQDPLPATVKRVAQTVDVWISKGPEPPPPEPDPPPEAPSSSSSATTSSDSTSQSTTDSATSPATSPP